MRMRILDTQNRPLHLLTRMAMLWVVAMLMLALGLSLAACGTAPTRIQAVKPPRPNAALMVRPAPVPLLTEPVTAQSVLEKHADEMTERHMLAAQLNALIDWVLGVTE